MSLHIGAKPGDIADTVLITGDPLRAKHIAMTALENPVCYNEIRGMLGYTGTYRGQRVSVQGTGMGIPSTAIYVHELIHGYGVRTIVRVGTCGAIQKEIAPGELIVAEQAYTDSAAVQALWPVAGDVVSADPVLVARVKHVAQKMSLQMRSGAVFSTDLFYHPNPDRWKRWDQKGMLGVEMESSILFAMGALYAVKTLSVLVVSDNIIDGSMLSALDRERMGREGVELVLQSILKKT